MELSDVIGSSWLPILQDEFNKEYLQKLSKWLAYTRQSQIIYPDSEDVFRSLKLCPYGQVKVVILGTEPYPQGNADGLCFSYKGGLRQGNGIQSLDVILDEIERDCYDGFNVNKDYQLDYLAKQGVLLLNSTLTVTRNNPGSHRGYGWERLTKTILLSLIKESPPKVFLVWGNEAKNLLDQAFMEDEQQNGFSNYIHLVLKAKHPASDLYSRDSFGRITTKYPNGFTGCKHFSQCNQFLLDNNIPCIDWLNTFESYLNEKLSNQPPF